MASVMGVMRRPHHMCVGGVARLIRRVPVMLHMMPAVGHRMGY